MKKHLLAIAALAWTASVAAQDWEAPLPPGDEAAVTIEDGGHYYATPKGTGQFLRGSNSWGTQASLDVKGYEVVMKDTVDVQGNPGWGFYFPVVKGGDFLFTESGGDNMFCDAYNNSKTLSEGRGHITYQFTLNEDGVTYRITHHYAPTASDGGSCYLGWDGLTLGESGVPRLAYLDPNSTVEIEDEETGETVEQAPFIDWAFIPTSAFVVYEAKLKLYDMLNNGDEAGVELDDILAVYNNPDATVEDIEKAISTLNDRIMASGDDEIDVTLNYIKNADTGEGWDGDFGLPGVSDSHTNWETGASLDYPFMERWTWEAQLGGSHSHTLTVTLPAGEYRLEACVLAVRQSDTSQSVTGVHLFADPGAGLYSETEEISTGNGTPEFYSIDFTTIGKPVTLGVKFENTNANWVAADNFKLIFKGFISNPKHVELLGVQSELEAILDSEDKFTADSYNALGDLIDEVANMLDDDAATEDDKEALSLKAKELIAKIGTEKVAYNKMTRFLDKVNEDMDTYEGYGSFYEALSTYQAAVGEKYDGGELSIEDIDAHVAGYEDLLLDYMLTYIKSGEVRPGDDISPLIRNRDMDQGETWVNTAGNPQIPGWNPESTSPWGYDQSAGEFWNMDFDFYQDIENLPAGKYTVSFQGFYRWGNPEDVAREYDPEKENDPKLIAVIYGNNVETPFQSICRGRATAEQLGGNTGGYAECGTDDDGNKMYMPNSMTTFAQTIIRDPEAYKSSATAVVGPDGHLRIGIKCNSGSNPIWNRWVIFDEFRLTYVGSEADMLFEEVLNQVAALKSLRDQSVASHSFTQDISDKVDDVAAKGTAVATNSATTFDEVMDIFNVINETKEEINKTNNNIDALYNEFKYYHEVSEEEAPDNTAEDFPSIAQKGGEDFQKIYQNIYDNIFVPKSNFKDVTAIAWADTTALLADLKNINPYFVGSIVATVKDATEENPGDVTSVIRNPRMQVMMQTSEWEENANEYSYKEEDSYELQPEDLSDVAWSVDLACWNNWVGGGSPKGQFGLAEYYNTKFDMHQYIKGLLPGYYRLTVDGFYRGAGTSANAAEAHNAGTEVFNAMLYAQHWYGDSLSVETPLMSIVAGSDESFDGEDGIATEYIGSEDAPEATYYLPNTREAVRNLFDAGHYKANTVTFYTDGGEMRIGLKKDVAVTNDWTVFDEFKLYYLGTSTPTGIKEAQGAAFGAVARQAYYTIGGQKTSRLQKGVNIVVTTLSDGTVVTNKVLVK